MLTLDNRRQDAKDSEFFRGLSFRSCAVDHLLSPTWSLHNLQQSQESSKYALLILVIQAEHTEFPLKATLTCT
jgi:hypothetical protein